MKLEVRQLAECPECLATVGTWIYQQWWSRAHDSPDVVFNLLRTHTRIDRVPYTVVAFANGTPVASCCVIDNDCVHRPQYWPWVAAVFVQPALRRHGVGSILLQEAARIATRAGIEALYIDCLAATAPFYQKNGWTLHEREVGDKDSVVLRRKLDHGKGAH